MAWFFSMWIETITTQDALAIKTFFDQQQLRINHRNYLIKANEAGVITVDGISKSGITSESVAGEMTLIGHEFYRLLRKAPAFNYALTGVEVEHWRTIEELIEDPSDLIDINGLVIREDTYDMLRVDIDLVTFRPGYLWNPYQGEKWINQ